MLLVCAQCFSLWVIWWRSESSQPFTSSTITPHHSTSCSRAFLCAEQSSWPLISNTTSLSLCSAFPATELLEEGQVTSPLSSPINCSRLNKAQCLFNVCVAWIDIRDVKLPSPGWGTAQLGGSHTGGGLSSGADCGESGRVRGLGGSRLEWGPGPYSPHFLGSLVITWVQVSTEMVNEKYIAEIGKSFLWAKLSTVARETVSL